MRICVFNTAEELVVSTPDLNIVNDLIRPLTILLQCETSIYDGPHRCLCVRSVRKQLATMYPRLHVLVLYDVCVMCLPNLVAWKAKTEGGTQENTESSLKSY